MLEMGLYSAIAPWGLLLLSSLWIYPFVLEEVVKWAILKLASKDQTIWLQHGALVGLVFGVSEAVLYSMNAWAGGQGSALLLRVVLTIPMHVGSATLIAWGIKHKLGVLGLAGAMVIHASFNYLVG